MDSQSFSAMAGRPPPFLLCAQVDQKLRDVAATPEKICIFELFRVMATVFQLRGELWDRNVISLVSNEAARAALTGGAALALVFILRALAAQCDIAVWT